MRFVCLTHIDYSTKKLCTVEPMRTGPSFPNLKGMKFLWANDSDYPIELNNGIAKTAPKFYHSVDDDADISVVGVLSEHTESEINALWEIEKLARKPSTDPSFIWSDEDKSWISPISQLHG